MSLALTALIMLLPHMPGSLVPFLPTLFNIYTRLLFWDRERAAAVDGSEVETRFSAAVDAATWEECRYSPDNDGLSIPHPLGYFTILYGLYPINFVDYIRKPQRYLRHANAPNADDIEVQPSEIRHRSERYRQWHLLHPNFYSLTIESEKTDLGRWIKSEPPDIVAECVALCLPVEHGITSPFDALVAPRTATPVTSENSERDGSDHALLGGALALPAAAGPSQPMLGRQRSQSSQPSTREATKTQTREAGADSPTLPPHLVLSTSQTDLQDMINSNKAIKSGLHQSLANDSVPSLSLSYHESLAEKSSARASNQQLPLGTSSPTLEANEQVAELQRQIMLLKNDLTFERYMKQQHMIHIGTLQRWQIKEAASEAEMQKLIMSNRTLKLLLEESKKGEMQAKKESEKSRALAKKWESDLSAKLRNLRAEQKKWHLKGPASGATLRLLKRSAKRSGKMVCDTEGQELKTQQAMESNESSIGELERLRHEVERLKEAESQKQRQRQSAQHEATEAERQVEALRMELDAPRVRTTTNESLFPVAGCRPQHQASGKP